MWILNITMGWKGSSKIIGAAIAPIAALASLVWRSEDLHEMMMTKRTAAAVKVTGRMVSLSAGALSPDGSAQKTTVALTTKGRAALSAYTQALRDLLGGLDADAKVTQAGTAKKWPA
jgi:hypothetical protein